MPKKSLSSGNSHQIKFIVLGLIIIGAFFRFYQLDSRMQFNWDQIRDAWVMKDIIDDNKFPLLGPVAKGTSGFYIGPSYYYLLSPFYIFTNLDPIASGIFVGVVSIVTLIILYEVVKRTFSIWVAIISLAFYAFSIHAIGFDRIPWSVAFLPLLSIGIFYFLLRLLQGDKQALVGLALIIGFTFHIHFTAIYFVVIVLLCLPFIRWSRKMIGLTLVSLLFFFLWFLPHIISSFITHDSSGSNLIKYVQTYYHGLHITRVLQLLQDGFIEFESLFYFRELKMLKFIILPLFSFFYIQRNGWVKSKNIIYVVWIWFLVPLLIMSVYSGEISNYYFATTRTIAVITTSYVIVALFQNKHKIIQIVIIFLCVVFIGKNIEQFFRVPTNGGLNNVRSQVKDAVSQGVIIPFAEGDSKSYFYYLYGERAKLKSK